MKPDYFIDALGGTTSVAKLCECHPQAVSLWRTHGIPRYRVLHLRLLRPDLPWDQLRDPRKQTEE